jgi:hypothetical protein
MASLCEFVRTASPEAIAMRSKVIAALMLAIATAALANPLFAHHGTAAFENGTKVTLNKAVVTEWIWSNPHCLLQFDVKGDDGKVVHWVGETQNPVSMTDRGWSKSAIKAGDEVTIVMLPVKNGMALGRVVSVVLPNGKTLISGEGVSRTERNQLERQVREGTDK